MIQSVSAPKPLARASRRLSRLSRPVPAKPIPSAYYLANRDRIIAQGRAWYQAHRETILAKCKAAYAKNPQKYIRRVHISQARRQAQQAA